MADFDSNIAEALANDATFLGLLEQLTKAATAEVLIRDANPCTKCSCKHIRMVSVPDYKLKLQIMEFLANRGVGRPAAVDGVRDEDKITFIREVRK